MITERQLLKIKEDIEQAKEAVSGIKGQMTAVLKQLKEEWDCNSLEEAKEKKNDLEVELNDIDKKINSLTKELQEKYDL